MFGVRAASFMMRSILHTPKFTMLPKFQYSQSNKESTTLMSRTALLPSNLIIQNLLEMLQKLKEESEQEGDKNIMNISLLNQGTLRMSHVKICRQLQ